MAYWFPAYAPERILLSLGPLTVYWYGVLVAIGIFAALMVSRTVYRRRGGSDAALVDLTWFAVIFGLIGARLWHVFVFQWQYYSLHPEEIVRIWEGGIAIQGAIIAGVAAIYWFSKRRKLQFLSLTDAIAVGLPLGQAIGRWGNFFNQELYGMPTNLPWGIFIAPEHRLSGYESFAYFHPAFVYESALNGLLYLLLARHSRRGFEGSSTALYLIGYGCIRFLVDFIRIDPMPSALLLRYSQLVSFIFIAAGAILYYHKKKRTVGAQPHL